MKIKIPSDTSPILKQSNSSSKLLGNIVDSFNLDLTSNLGKIKTTKTLASKTGVYSKVAFGVDFGDFGNTLSGIATYSNQLFIINGGGVWVGGNSPSDGFTRDASSGTQTVSIENGDIKTYNNQLWTTNGIKIARWAGGSWTDIYTYPATVPSLLETHKTFLYFSFDNYKVGRIDTTNTPTSSGTGSLNLNKPGFVISSLVSDGNNLWIGLVNVFGGFNEKTYIYKWDGSTSGQAQTEHLIEARGVLSMTIVNGVPYAVDSKGRLLGFNGTYFEEVDRLPLKMNETLYNGYGQDHRRAICPNGMVYDAINDEILINVSNVKILTSSVPTFFDFPGGVWSYKKETRLHHKYSPSTQPIANSGTTGLTDYGQYNVVKAGAIATIGLTPTGTEKGRIFFGCAYFTGEITDIDTTGLSVGVFTDDTAVTSQNNGYFITTEIRSSTITDTWKQITALYKKLLSSTDKIILKYRTRNDIPTQTNITWTDIDRVTTSSDLSATYSVGDEVQVAQANGSGKSFHITSITGTLVILDDSMPSGVIGLKGVAKFSKWKKLGEVTYTDEQQYKSFTPSVQGVSPNIQIKVAFQSTGDNEIDSIFINSDSLIK